MTIQMMNLKKEDLIEGVEIIDAEYMKLALEANINIIYLKKNKENLFFKCSCFHQIELIPIYMSSCRIGIHRTIF